jgi:hypothetical protein
MNRRLIMTLQQEEYSALLKLAMSELRSPEGQLHFLLREELSKKGLLGSDQNTVSDQQIESDMNKRNIT